MPTLLIEIEGQMQSWGYRSRFSEKDTGMEPTKSGLIGLLAASLGYNRDAELNQLSGLRYGVRVDRQGIIKKDFQTAQTIINAEGKIISGQLINRYYLSDARFIAGIEGEMKMLADLKEALINPFYSQFLGRRSYLPTTPLINPNVENPVDLKLEIALRNYPLPERRNRNEGETFRIVRDAKPGEESPSQDFRQDVPVSFAKKEYLVRKVITEWITIKPEEGARDVHIED
ncbi:MAG: type I-E CRISPR-associated protein Cas5/CasD [Ignavibacteriales bacterium]|nr:type I-E CRISPR-associated protein Cas5/CasD [Ignavibacteriales bacterium]MCF8315326.1 type I-E CRISPR-associated protein Cas5/CasD [Ignavibacteriales bacterium]MCF8436782.1 type I-E CRISPR-associated protein Cas5/CasD [Ignavibacteriales bacterium]